MSFNLKFFALLLNFYARLIFGDDPYYPCQSWITFGVDDSNTLNSYVFKNQLKFISNAIGFLNHPERIQISGAYNHGQSWKSGLSIPELQSFVQNTQQYGPYNLLLQFSDIVSNLPKIQPTSFPISAIIFISNTSSVALLGAHVLKPYLANVKITFVLLGSNVDKSTLQNFTSNFIPWKNLLLPEPEGWNEVVAANAYGCQLTSPTTSVTTATTLVPYLPCQSWISFSYDDSSKLSNADFKKQMAFIANAIIPITYPDRLRVNGAFTGVASWNSHQTNEQIYNEIINVEQTEINYSLLQEFLNLLTDFEALGNSTTWPIGSLIFISDTSDHALANANHFFPLLNGVKITFVLLGPDADQTKLTQYSNNFIYWSDLSKPLPDNWDALSYAAYGCNITAIF